MANPYDPTQCTAGAADIFPCLQDVGKYGNFGNGGDWFSHAQEIGLPTSGTPQVGWLASFHNMGQFGHVAQIKAVNPDGTLTIFGRNFHEDGKDSTDNVPVSDLTGCFNPPCAAVDGVNATLDTATNGGALGLPDFGKMGQQLQGMAMVSGGLLIIGVGLALLLLGAKETSQIRGVVRGGVRKGRRVQRKGRQIQRKGQAAEYKRESAVQGAVKADQRDQSKEQANYDKMYKGAQREGKIAKEGETEEDRGERDDANTRAAMRRQARTKRAHPSRRGKEDILREETPRDTANRNRARIEELRRQRTEREANDPIPF